MKNANLTTANPMLMMQRRNVYWETKLNNQVRKTWGVTYVLLIMEEVLSIKMLNLKNKSHFYHLGRGGGGGERRERERSQHFGCHNKSSRSIFFGPTFKLCQRRLILPPFPLKTRRPPPPTRKTRSPSHPSFQAKNGDLFLTSAQRFSENVKFMISCLSL